MVFTCDCGLLIRADGQDDLVDAVQHHAGQSHGLPFTREQVLTLAQRVDHRTVPPEPEPEPSS
jgi:predicted small metal-binding protein